MHRALSLPSSRRGTSFYVCFPADSAHFLIRGLITTSFLQAQELMQERGLK
ncbi:hypothetical protein NC653_007734 [Populus alba x Populus x berolinensis]|uniref:Uncharacterized protein n=1 Tax=Populus alba x Populus x berolinensis TaxID=444605 RepID=A0AAD6RHT3_9ROSI|nr:hypothetical protein NC653_007728 [Populus alba x Populus x berolinensis]KAJ7009190.1 hypothetical protein NC653_007734 [Populus alba x Populus x berolinensis]